MNSILEEDIKNIADSKLVNWQEFNNKSILITGATGLICSIMIKAFCKKKLNLKMYLLERYPNLSSQEWEYCCLCMFNFDSKTEARLLGINPSSVSTKRLRFRQKLGISAL